MEQGIEQGIEQGRNDERVALTLRQLTRKFGTLPDEIVTQVYALSSEQLLSLAESLLDFSAPDDLTAWLAANPPAGADPAAMA